VTSLVLGGQHGVFLDAMVTVLSHRGYNVTASSTIQGTLEAVRERTPDVCLIDCCFTGADCIEVIGQLTDASPDTKVVVLSADPDTTRVVRALESGAAGYLHKSRGVKAVTTAIDRVRHGEVVVDMPRAITGQQPQREDLCRLADRLTPREQGCLSLLVEGLDTPAMAAKLGVSQATVRTHVQSVLSKLGVHSRLEAASLAVRCHLLGP
jgi:two-component system, NarL family, nitrate/nitrite response regulator NarL